MTVSHYTLTMSAINRPLFRDVTSSRKCLILVNTTPLQPPCFTDSVLPRRWKTAPHVQAEPASSLPASFQHWVFSPLLPPPPFLSILLLSYLLLPPSPAPLWLQACRPFFLPATWPGAHMDSWHSSRPAHKALCAVPCRQQQQYNNKR